MPIKAAMAIVAGFTGILRINGNKRSIGVLLDAETLPLVQRGAMAGFVACGACYAGLTAFWQR